jgi:Ca2+-binding EF-hand superfamily protein
MRTALLTLLSVAIVVGVGANEIKPSSFRTLDVDKDGKISGGEAQSYNPLSESFRAADADGDGFLTEREYVAWAKRTVKKTP